MPNPLAPPLQNPDGQSGSTSAMSSPSPAPVQPASPAPVDSLGGPLGRAALGMLAAATKAHVENDAPTVAPKVSQKEVAPSPTPKRVFDFSDLGGKPVVSASADDSTFTKGDPALEGFQKLSQVPTEILDLVEKYPTAAKLLHNAAVNASKQKDTGNSDGTKTHTVHGPDGGLIGHVVSKYIPLADKA